MAEVKVLNPPARTIRTGRSRWWGSGQTAGIEGEGIEAGKGGAGIRLRWLVLWKASAKVLG